MKNISKLHMGLLMGLVVSSAAFAALPVAAACGVAYPSFDSPTIPHCGEKIKALAALPVAPCDIFLSAPLIVRGSTEKNVNHEIHEKHERV